MKKAFIASATILALGASAFANGGAATSANDSKPAVSDAQKPMKQSKTRHHASKKNVKDSTTKE